MVKPQLLLKGHACESRGASPLGAGPSLVARGWMLTKLFPLRLRVSAGIKGIVLGLGLGAVVRAEEPPAQNQPPAESSPASRSIRAFLVDSLDWPAGRQICCTRMG